MTLLADENGTILYREDCYCTEAGEFVFRAWKTQEDIYPLHSQDMVSYSYSYLCISQPLCTSVQVILCTVRVAHGSHSCNYRYAYGTSSMLRSLGCWAKAQLSGA